MKKIFVLLTRLCFANGSMFVTMFTNTEQRFQALNLQHQAELRANVCSNADWASYATFSARIRGQDLQPVNFKRHW